MPSGGRAEWMKRLRERILPPLRAFKPELLIISAGFDAANHDVGNQGVDRR
jgi:acetoin utilization deacetylase AcuC-like enzyme